MIVVESLVNYQLCWRTADAVTCPVVNLQRYLSRSEDNLVLCLSVHIDNLFQKIIISLHFNASLNNLDCAQKD